MFPLCATVKRKYMWYCHPSHSTGFLENWQINSWTPYNGMIDISLSLWVSFNILGMIDLSYNGTPKFLQFLSRWSSVGVSISMKMDWWPSTGQLSKSPKWLDQETYERIHISIYIDISTYLYPSICIYIYTMYIYIYVYLYSIYLYIYIHI